MAWTSPRIWLEGAIITAPQMNSVSANLNETAPAKAQSSGDLFYATGANEIERLALGSGGQVLTPVSGVPQWAASPTPITTQGDMVYGNTAGNATRIPAGASGQVLVCRNRRVQWVDRVDKRDWWEQDEWWLDGAPENTYQIGAGGSVPGWPPNSPMLVCDNLVVSGTVNIDINPTVIRAREIILQGNTTIRAKIGYRMRYPFGSEINTVTGPTGGAGAIGSADTGRTGGTGRRACGGGGGAGIRLTRGSTTTNTVTTPAQNGSNAPALNMEHIREALYGRAEFYGGRGGVAWQATEAAGGCLILVAETLNRGSDYTLTVNCDGDDDEEGAGGGGGGLGVVVIKDGTEGVTVTANGGRGAPAHTRNVNPVETWSASGNGGNGTAYLGTAFPE